MLVILSYIIILIWILLVVTGIQIYKKRIKRTDLIYSKKEFWLVVVLNTLCTLLHFLLLQYNHVQNNALLIINSIACVALISLIHNVIEFDESGFWTKNILGRKKRYEYKDILMIKHKKQEYTGSYRHTDYIEIIHLPGKKVHVNIVHENYSLFSSKMSKKYKEVHGHKIK